MGHMMCGERSGVFPGAILRADESSIEPGSGSFILDLSVIEDPSGCPVAIGDSSLTGIGSVKLDRAHLGDRYIVAAGALIPRRPRWSLAAS